ncbi:MAG: hypothetical protein HY647_00435 [Acidobacteria bacterium]|nr:hypothetical protein [Acidobacteriota bacterium]
MGWLRKVGVTLHQLWLEITGALFLGMGALAAPSAWKEWHAYQHGGSLWRPLIVALFMVMAVGFGVFSFLRARRMR